MVRLAKVGLAIVIIVSVASILVTPDPSDDVDGVIARHNIVNAVVVPVSVSQSHSLPPVTFRFAPIAMHRTPHNVLDLACVRLCSRPGSPRDIPQRFCHSSFLLHFLEEPWRTLEFGIHMRSSRCCSTQTFTVRGDSPLLQKCPCLTLHNVEFLFSLEIRIRRLGLVSPNLSKLVLRVTLWPGAA